MGVGEKGSSLGFGHVRVSAFLPAPGPHEVGRQQVGVSILLKLGLEPHPATTA